MISPLNITTAKIMAAKGTFQICRLKMSNIVRNTLTDIRLSFTSVLPISLEEMTVLCDSSIDLIFTLTEEQLQKTNSVTKDGGLEKKRLKTAIFAKKNIIIDL